jgi:hypothetical protein
MTHVGVAPAKNTKNAITQISILQCPKQRVVVLSVVISQIKQRAIPEEHVMRGVGLKNAIVRMNPINCD